MRAVVEGRLDASSDAFQLHIDRCLGCRACEPVCPSGVEYGLLLEGARAAAAESVRPGLLTRLFLRVFRSPILLRLFMAGGRLVRATGLPRLLARILPRKGVLGEVRTGLAMLAASSGPWLVRGRGPGEIRGGPAEAEAGSSPAWEAVPVALLRGCVQEGLFGRVNGATGRVLEANGFRLVDVDPQECCGALHAHAGDLESARALARRNVEAFEEADARWIVVNAAGCGAVMKEYGELLSDDPELAGRAAALAERVVDATELLAERGPATGGILPLRATYDAPCHLLHAQGIEDAPLAVLRAVPGLELVPLRDAAECCGGAGIYGLTHPDLGGRISDDKVAAVRESGAEVVATPNPGCMMQIGAGLMLDGGRRVGVVHPVELLDESYRRKGVYG